MGFGSLILAFTLAQGAKAESSLKDNREVLEILDRSLLAGGAPHSRYFSDRRAGLRFRLPWPVYELKTRRQVEALIGHRLGEDPDSSSTYVAGFYPKEAQPMPLPAESLVGERLGYFPYLLLWYQDAPDLKDSAAFSTLARALRRQRWRQWLPWNIVPWQEGRAAKVLNDISLMAGLMPPSFLAASQAGSLPTTPPPTKIEGYLWQPKHHRLFVDLAPSNGVRQKVLIQGAKGRLLFFGLYHKSPDDGLLLINLASSLTLQKNLQLKAFRSLPGSPFYRAYANEITAALGAIGLLLATIAVWKLRRAHKS